MKLSDSRDNGLTQRRICFIMKSVWYCPSVLGALDIEPVGYMHKMAASALGITFLRDCTFPPHCFGQASIPTLSYKVDNPNIIYFLVRDFKRWCCLPLSHRRRSLNHFSSGRRGINSTIAVYIPFETDASIKLCMGGFNAGGVRERSHNSYTKSIHKGPK